MAGMLAQSKCEVLPSLEHAMKLSSAMSRLGTETAFEVLVRARALEAQGQGRRPPRDRRARLRHPAEHHRGRRARPCEPAGPTTARPPACPSCARRSPTISNRSRGTELRRREHRRHARAASRSCSSPSWPCSRRATRRSTPNPGFPIYESMINFTGAKAVPSPIREENEFALDVDELEVADHPEDQAADHQQPAATRPAAS